jgi:hypothetical protein
MEISLELPGDVAPHFAVTRGGVSRAALEALVIEGAPSSRLTTGQVRRTLGVQPMLAMTDTSPFTYLVLLNEQARSNAHAAGKHLDR